MSDFCENCNPHSSYYPTAIGECLVDFQFAETCNLTLFTFLKIFISLKNESLKRQFGHAVLYVMLMVCVLFCGTLEFKLRVQTSFISVERERP